MARDVASPRALWWAQHMSPAIFEGVAAVLLAAVGQWLAALVAVAATVALAAQSSQMLHEWRRGYFTGRRSMREGPQLRARYDDPWDWS